MVNILVVDDDAAVCESTVLRIKSLQSYFPDRTLNVLWAKDGREALAICHAGKMSMVLTDFNMPKMDGVQLQEHLKDELSWSRPEHIVLMTANSTVQESDFGGRFSKLLHKPFSRTELLEVVRLAMA